jgi:hypothetical protein
MDLPEVIRTASSASVPLAITCSAYWAVRMVILLVAVFGPKKQWADRAMEVLRLLRRDRSPK